MALKHVRYVRVDRLLKQIDALEPDIKACPNSEREYASGQKSVCYGLRLWLKERFNVDTVRKEDDADNGRTFTGSFQDSD